MGEFRKSSEKGFQEMQSEKKNARVHQAASVEAGAFSTEIPCEEKKEASPACFDSR